MLLGRVKLEITRLSLCILIIITIRGHLYIDFNYTLKITIKLLGKVAV
jgi:hypothetical protein